MRGRFVLQLALVVFLAGGTLASAMRPSAALHILDVGQGDAMLLRQGRTDILVDGGPDSSVLTRLGDVRPFWDRTIEIVVLTHPDEDHLRGLLDVIARERVRTLLLPEIPKSTGTFRAFVTRVSAAGIPVRAARAGQRISVGDLSLRVLAPDAELLRRAQKKPNAGGVVIRGDAQQASFLLTADIEAPTEQHLLRTAPEDLDVDILKVPHHGSKTSSTAGFLRAVSPRLSAVSVGRKNRYGHPHPSVLGRYDQDRLLRTDERGTVSFSFRGDHMGLRCARACRPQPGPSGLP
jgi:competence protein ComEC